MTIFFIICEKNLEGKMQENDKHVHKNIFGGQKEMVGTCSEINLWSALIPHSRADRNSPCGSI